MNLQSHMNSSPNNLDPINSKYKSPQTEGLVCQFTTGYTNPFRLAFNHYQHAILTLDNISSMLVCFPVKTIAFLHFQISHIMANHITWPSFPRTPRLYNSPVYCRKFLHTWLCMTYCTPNHWKQAYHNPQLKYRHSENKWLTDSSISLQPMQTHYKGCKTPLRAKLSFVGTRFLTTHQMKDLIFDGTRVFHSSFHPPSILVQLVSMRFLNAELTV